MNSVNGLLITLIITIAILISGNTQAQVSNNTMSDEQPVWELGAGAILLNVPDYPGSSNNRFRAIPFPYYIYRGETLRADDEGSRARLLTSDRHELGLSFAFNFPVRSGNNPIREGMPDIDTLMSVGPRMLFRFLDPKSDHKLNFTFSVRANYSSDFNNRFRAEGLSFEPRLNYWYRWAKYQTTLFTGLGFESGSVEIQRFFYEVPQSFASPTRPRYSAHAGLTEVSGSLGLGLNVNPHLFIFASFSLRNLDLARNRTSPLVVERNNHSSILGLVWTFYESDQKVIKL